MADVGQVYYRVIDQESGGYISTDNIDIYTDIVAAYEGATQFNKVGIQAPPGTKVVLNKTKTIMVGRTGIYELDDDIAITNMYFVRPRKYVKDAVRSEEARTQGMQGINAANDARQQALQNLASDYPKPPTEESDPSYEAYWSRYEEIQSTYMRDYEAALSLFSTGNNGIYKLPNEQDIDAPENFEQLQNIIVDFIYE